MHMSFDERKEYAERKKQQKNKKYQTEVQETPNVVQRELPLSPNLTLGIAVAPHDHLDYERAIRDSIAATSLGNTAEDELIERAIRASISELQSASQDHDEDALERAIQTSLAEASHARHTMGSHDELDGEHRQQLEAAIRLSIMGNHSSPLESKVRDNRGDMDDSGIDTDDDLSMKAALEESKKAAVSVSPEMDDDLKRALEQSRLHDDQTKDEKSEEEIVIEYIKKQSLAEEEHRQKMVRNLTGTSDRGGGPGIH